MDSCLGYTKSNGFLLQDTQKLILGALGALGYPTDFLGFCEENQDFGRF